MTAAAGTLRFIDGRLRSAPLPLSAQGWTILGLMAAALLLRWPSFGNPAFHVDEDFYLLVGDRMLHGAIPYVDVWDRKPIGLFLILAAIRMLGGEGIVQYQLVAALFAGGTAAAIAAIARPMAGRFGGIAAGLVYLVWCETVEGGGGQSPIFYNLFMALAAGCTFAAVSASDPRRFRARAFAAMGLSGIAIQVKYPALFEGVYFGLLLGWWSLRHGATIGRAALLTAALAATALAPTIAAIAAYAWLGQLDAFWFANFVSIFHRGPTLPADLHYNKVQMFMHVLPLAVCFGASLWQIGQNGDRAARARLWLVSGWTVAAAIGVVSVGGFFCHYVLPLFVPLAVGAAPIFSRRTVGPFFALTTFWLPFCHLSYPDFTTTKTAEDKMARLVAMVPPQVATGCMQMLAGPPLLYQLTHACTVSRYIFPDHLIGGKERDAIGVDTDAEIRRIIARHPLVLVTDDTPRDVNRGVFAYVRAARAAAYRRVGRVVMDEMPIDVWVRRDAPARR